MKRQAPIISTLATFFGLALGGCGDQAGTTALTIRVENGVGGHTYELRCDPPGGSAPQPDRLCAVLADHSQEMLFSAPNVVCIGGFTTPHISVKGRYRDKPVNEPDVCGHPEAARFWFELLPPPPPL